jgi:hypothetical protein
MSAITVGFRGIISKSVKFLASLEMTTCFEFSKDCSKKDEDKQRGVQVSRFHQMPAATTLTPGGFAPIIDQPYDPEEVREAFVFKKRKKKIC